MLTNPLLKFVLVTQLLWLGGCATAMLTLRGESHPKAGPKNPVVQIVALWQPAEGTGLDNLSSRGFAGQIMFFTGQNSLPAEVKGDVRIYVFDDQGPENERMKPIHQFDFPADAWATHMSKGKLGPAYTVFIPYTRKATQEAECSLRIRFTPPDAPMVNSEMINIVLPGTTQAKDPATVMNRSGGSGARKPVPNSPATDQKQIASTSEVQHASHASETSTKPVRKPAAPQPLTQAERERILAEVSGKPTHSEQTRDTEPMEPNAPSNSALEQLSDNSAKRTPRKHPLEETGSDSDTTTGRPRLETFSIPLPERGVLSISQ